MKIYLYPTYIKIKGYLEDEETAKRICNFYSAYETMKNGYKKKTFQAAIEDEENDTLILGGGISKDVLNYYYPDAEIIDQTKLKKCKKVNDYILLKKPRDEIQKKAIQFLGYKYPQKYLALQTGQGKTYCAINYAHQCKKLTMIIVDQENLAEQWKTKIKEYTSARDKEIYMISGRRSVQKLYKMKDSERNKIKFIIAIYKTLQSLYESDELRNFFTDFGIGLKIYDEAHLEYKNIFYINTCSEIETIYLSATPERVNPSEYILYKKLFDSVKMHKTKLTKKYYNVCILNIDLGIDPLEQAGLFNQRGFDITKYHKLLIEKHSKAFYGAITNSLSKVFVNDFNRKKRVAIIVKLIDQTKLVKKEIDTFLDSDARKKEYTRQLTVESLTGETSKEKRKEILENTDIIVTTDRTFCKGLDVKDLEIIINFVPISCAITTSNLNQFTGRLRKLPNKEVFYVDCIDQSVDNLVKMSKNRIKYYETIAKKIYNMNGYGVEVIPKKKKKKG